jgi:DNA-binding NarL/FixJ family response regulator
MHRQLSIPYAMSQAGHFAFVLAQDGADFGDADLALARAIQPMLGVIDRQAQILATTATALDGVGLTTRETAVLQLLTQGMTAGRIGHTLGISPRTVHTHIAHVYRKLDVTDRVQAVLVTQRLTQQHTNGNSSPAAAPSTPRPSQVVFAVESAIA